LIFPIFCLPGIYISIAYYNSIKIKGKYVTVLDFVSQVREAILINVYLDVRNPGGGSGFWNEGYMGKGREIKSSVYKQPETKVDGSFHS
jgi:hypothetical protein